MMTQDDVTNQVSKLQNELQEIIDKDQSIPAWVILESLAVICEWAVTQYRKAQQ